MKRSSKFCLFMWLLASSGCTGSSPEQAPAEQAPISSQAPASLTTGTVTTSEETGWTQTGPLAAARLLHTATRLQDGRVMVVGGYTPSAELYDPASGTWSATGAAPANYRGATATLLPSGQVLVTGGNDLGITASLYAPSTGNWTATSPLATSRYHHTAALLADGRVLVTGGASSEYGGTVLTSAELFDPATGTWTAVGALSGARHRHTATVLSNGQVLVAGGEDASGRLTSAELFNPATGTWTAVGALGTARSNHTATLLHNGQVLVTGGALDGEPSTRAELFDPATGLWSSTTPMAHPRRLHSATLLANGRVLVSGGFDDTTGIQAATELYDPVRGVWDAMPALAAARYQHTATLLSNGRVLVAGGFSNNNQASTEVFSAALVKVVLDEGTGWQLINVTGANTEEMAAYDADMYVVSDETGITHAPLPQGLREELAAASATKTTVFFLNKRILDEIRISEEQGAPTPYLQSIMEPMEPSLMADDDRCPDHTATQSKSIPLYKPLNINKDLGEGFSGSLTTTGGISASGAVEVQVVKIRRPVLWFGCTTVGFDLNHVKLTATGSLDYGATLNGTVSYGHTWKFPIARPTLTVIPIPIGPVVIPIDISLPITAGIDLQASTTGQISYTASKSVSLQYVATCTFDGCSSDSNFSTPSPSQVDFNGSIQGRIQPSVWAQAALRAGIFDAAYAQVGVRPYLDGDVWGYNGSNCGDADGDGIEEFVQGAYFDLNWRLSVTGEVSAVFIGSKEWTSIFSTGKQHIFFKNLQPTVPGGSTVFEPMITGLATPGLNTNTGYNIRMRPCFPFPKDNEKASPEFLLRNNSINYLVEWGDGSSKPLTGATFDTVLLERHAWGTEGAKQLKITALSDGHGRTYNSSYTRTIQVQPEPGLPAEYFREVHVDGRLDLMDDEPIGSNPRGTLWINDVAFLDPDSPTHQFFYTKCVGDEVRAEVTLVLTLQSDNVTVKADATGKMFEEESCDNDDLETTQQVSATVARDGQGQLYFQLLNPEITTEDSITFDVTVSNYQAP